MWSFLWSSSQVFVHLVSICSFLVLVCREWRCISWTRIHIFHHVLAFSSLISFLVFFFWVVRCVFPFLGLLRVLLLLSSYYLSIQLFRYALLVAIFSSKNVRSLWRLVVGMFLCHVLPIIDRIFFRCFGMSCFVCVVLLFVDISLISLLSPELSGLFPQVLLLFFLLLSLTLCSHIFQGLFFYHFVLFRRFFICVSSQISHLGFDCFFVLFEEIPIFSHTNFAPA